MPGAFVGFSAFILLIAGAALFAPIGAKVLAVMLLAGPHNWIEFRYFLSRLPARWPRHVRWFFVSSFAGLGVLGVGYILLMLALFSGHIEWSQARDLYGLWGAAICLWAAGLLLLAKRLSSGQVQRSVLYRDSETGERLKDVQNSGGVRFLHLVAATASSFPIPFRHCLLSNETAQRDSLKSCGCPDCGEASPISGRRAISAPCSIVRMSGRAPGWTVPVAIMVLLALGILAWTQPIWFGVLLVYIHPLVSIAILDRELQRNKSKATWRRGFRCALLLVPIVIGLFWWKLQGADFVCAENSVAKHILNQTGAAALPTLGAFLLSTLVFLDLLHYAVWLIAIPNWAAGWRQWNPRSTPLLARFPKLNILLTAAVSIAGLAAIGLWFCFATNYVATSQIYFVLAIMHVLAEIPFLAWAWK